eukprot:TRINITY_DN383_c0_g1_i3.p1 TRINITY_DN383_c0_g1~~TRINITY_DN383_c0_g1_i3.p1  ORF type:complete len:199 (-),score=10.37 TRINITY_DN383_c0_g1_i3:45-641(-)
MLQILIPSSLILGACAGIEGGPAERAAANHSSLRGAYMRQEVDPSLIFRSDVGVLGYQQHAHLNCYTGHGGKVSEPSDGFQAGVHKVDACGRACDENYCACFVYFWKYNECFLRDSCELSECEQGSEGKESYDFDTYTAGPVNTPCFCEHGKGQWIPYDPPGTLACTCVSCDPGYMVTDMYCVPEQRGGGPNLLGYEP